MSFSFGNKIKVTIFGASHADFIGVEIEGMPEGVKIDEELLAQFMARRAPGNDEFSTPRKEPDAVVFEKGLVDSVTTGEVIRAVIKNTNVRKTDYENLRDVPRPGHADFTAWAKYKDTVDMSGGGFFSGRMTAPMCIAGGIFKQLFEEKEIYIGAHIASVGNISDDLFDSVNVTEKDFVANKDFPVINNEKGEEMKNLIRAVRAEGDSIGGMVECAICGLPAGIGDALYGGIESRISSSVFAIPAVKGIEFGRGFESSKLNGSENNDAYHYTRN